MPHSDAESATVTRASKRRGPAAPAAARLIVVYPRDLAREVLLDDRRRVLGRRAEGTNAVVPHPTVSRRHAEITRDADGGHRVLDLGSHNGTWVDGARLSDEPVPLADQSVLRLGDVLAVYEASSPSSHEVPRVVSEDAIPGDSRAARALRIDVARAGPDPSPALVLGETGSGKERVARELHRLSGRRGPLLAASCAELTPQLFESSLFGHERGAFTGADSARPGLLRSAQGGSVFLDEIGELPVDLQAKLLRVIQESEVRPVGGVRALPIDVRFIAATNRDLAAEVERGAFRQDLLARLALWEIRVAPLRVRRADLLLWLDILHTAWSEQRGDRSPSALVLEPDAAEALLRADWPDNLRGLDRLVHRLAAGRRPQAPVPLAEVAPLIGDSSEPAVPAPVPAAPVARPPAPTRGELAEVLERLGGSVRATARHFGRDRRQIYRWMDAFGLREADAEEPDEG